MPQSKPNHERCYHVSVCDASTLANPFFAENSASRVTSLEKYKQWFALMTDHTNGSGAAVFFMRELRKLRGIYKENGILKLYTYWPDGHAEIIREWILKNK